MSTLKTKLRKLVDEHGADAVTKMLHELTAAKSVWPPKRPSFASDLPWLIEAAKRWRAAGHNDVWPTLVEIGFEMSPMTEPPNHAKRLFRNLERTPALDPE